MRKNLPGFTLMELLIVIGVLGILAAGLLAAIDPFEQLKKARDTNNRNASVELLQSLQRFYATHGDFPWNIDSYDAVCGRKSGQVLDGFDGISSGFAVSVQDGRLADCINGSLVLDGELKPTYIDGILGTNIFVGSDIDDKSDVVVCFQPESKSSRSDIATRFLVNTTSNGQWYNVVEQTGISPYDACPRQLGDCAQCFE